MELTEHLAELKRYYKRLDKLHNEIDTVLEPILKKAHKEGWFDDTDYWEDLADKNLNSISCLSRANNDIQDALFELAKTIIDIEEDK